MRKTDKTVDKHGTDLSTAELIDFRPRRITGSTVASWLEPRGIDPAMLFATQEPGATVTATSSHSAEPIETPSDVRQTFTLSDGTQITFATAR
jgi:hypothetical protein